MKERGNTSGESLVYTSKAVRSMNRWLTLRSLLLVLGLGPLAAMAILDPPALRCASVNVAGDVTLTWSVPTDPGGEFLEYQVFWSNSLAGPYVALPPVPVYATTSTFHAGAGANSGPVFYYMTTVSTGPLPNT
jgi:hypothetical protein